jgi:hypothetical protein
MIVACWTAALSASAVYALLTGLAGDLARPLGVPFAVIIVAAWVVLTVHHVIGGRHDRPDR